MSRPCSVAAACRPRLTPPSSSPPVAAVDPESHRQKLSELVEKNAGEIRNPLKGIPRHELVQNVTKFQQEKGLPEDILPLLVKGALVAQDPAAFEDLDDLDEQDRWALREEVTHRWKHPWPLYYTIILNSIAAAIQGWDQVCTYIFVFPPNH